MPGIAPATPPVRLGTVSRPDGLAGAPRIAHRRWQTDRWRFHAVVATSGVGFGLTAPSTSLLAVALGASGLVAGLVVSSASISLFLVDFFGTRVVPRLNARMALAVSSVIFGMGSFLSSVAPTWLLAMAARILQGFGVALFVGSGLQASVRLAEPGRRERRSVSSMRPGSVGWASGRCSVGSSPARSTMLTACPGCACSLPSAAPSTCWRPWRPGAGPRPCRPTVFAASDYLVGLGELGGGSAARWSSAAWGRLCAPVSASRWFRCWARSSVSPRSCSVSP